MNTARTVIRAPDPRAARDATPDGRSIMMFDGICGFCSAAVLFVARRSPRTALSFCPMQSPQGETILRKLGLPLTRYETLAVIKDGQVLLKSDAVLRLAGLMDFPWPLLAALTLWIPRALRNRLYELVARNRYRIAGRKEQCMVPDPELADRFLS